MTRLLFIAILFFATLAEAAPLWMDFDSPGGGRVTVKGKVKSPLLDTAVSELTLHYDGDVTIDLKSDKSLGRDGFAISETPGGITITASKPQGALYGAYRLLRNVNAGYPAASGRSVPAYGLRILNHWDNLDGTVERGYAGKSLWRWEELPATLSPRYEEYARACASVGINAAVLNNVNASSRILSAEYLQKVAALADVMRPYGITVYLSVNFASPVQLDSLPTADPLDPAVARWWKRKADEIYRLIPDFGGFLVKANSEGQPGPMDYGRTHAEGANMLARALKPHGGIVMWRAFVYSPLDEDRAKQAYLEFQPLDGKFDPNVIVQIKNGPIDFQPREPYSPLFGATPSTPQMVEFQITQEYLGHANHLAYLAPMWTEFYDYVAPESIVASSGVANIGDSECLTGNPMAQANWFAFGELSWDPHATPAEIADEWLRLSVYRSDAAPDAAVHDALMSMMLDSREAVVDYMMPMGLHHIFAFGHHYGPEPWCDVPGAREDWLPRYYHRADSAGLGFDRSPSGSDAVGQYPEPLRSRLSSIETCPEEFLLWFHHVPWNKTLKSGDTMWNTLCRHYESGYDAVKRYQSVWDSAKPYVDEALHQDVSRRLIAQARDARWWKDACLLYFQQYSNMPFPKDVEAPEHTLDAMKKVNLGITNYESPSMDSLDAVR